ncbi:hypothetical protein [Spirillospora sp. NPDC029432]|uniref:hypothetical protein n=1 Tax=Spirillospora sp. NPDC029432 TaxID=3154599 RepID=UPI0034545CF6
MNDKTAGQKCLDWFAEVPVRSMRAINGPAVWILDPEDGPRGARKVVCSPVINILRNSGPIAAAACLRSSENHGGASAVRPQGLLALGGRSALRGYGMQMCEFGGGRQRVMRAPRDLRVLRGDVRTARNEQGWSVFGGSEGADPEAPATAHVTTTSIKGGSGPSPWRRPV